MKWEYSITIFASTDGSASAKANREMNEKGDAGWELMAAVIPCRADNLGWHTLYFKRAKQ
jgi:hypothetical protein